MRLVGANRKNILRIGSWEVRDESFWFLVGSSEIDGTQRFMEGLNGEILQN